MVFLELFIRQGTAGYVYLAYGDNAFGVLQVVQRIDLAGVTLGGDKHQLVGGDNLALGVLEFVEFSRLIHVLGVGGNQEIRACALLDLLHQLGGTFEGVGDLNAGVFLLECFLQLSTRIAQGSSRIDLNLARHGSGCCRRSRGRRIGVRGVGTASGHGDRGKKCRAGTGNLQRSFHSVCLFPVV